VVAWERLGDWDTTGITGQRRVVLMGGSAEVDPASRVFVEGANGGDVLVLRASGSTTSYNAYLRVEVGAEPRPGSVGTLRIPGVATGSGPDGEGSDSPGVLCRVANAEAVWLAGGNQWDYLGGWATALHDSLRATAVRPAAIGGTSAGAVVLGELAFDAEHGTVTSDTALADPFHPRVSVRRSDLAQPELDRFLVDSHFMQRDREGRLLTFLARGVRLLDADTVYGLGLDERAALLVREGRYEVRAEPGRQVWLYRYVVGSDPEPDPGRPLEMTGVLRLGLGDGSGGAWPPSLEHAATDTMDVVAGRVRRR
jgi:cyanophycinase-like exopeptidase